jgi:hypothetical protein
MQALLQIYADLTGLGEFALPLTTKNPALICV